jgi:uncharacterized membrane protein
LAELVRGTGERNPKERIEMFGRSKTEVAKEKAVSGTELAVALARDRKFRRELMSAVGHGVGVRRRAARQIGLTALVSRTAADKELRRQLRELARNVQKAWTRVEKKRSHRLRNSLILLGAGGAAATAAVPQLRGAVSRRFSAVPVAGGPTPRTITESIEVEVPVSTAYNQWTQFEDFPLFMEGVDHVQQLDDTRLHWAATIGGKQAEWDAKILEQHPDRQVSWISEDGTKTRGTVTFAERGDSRTLISLSMSYQVEGIAEAIGSAAGLDARRVRSDLERFKELVKSRGTETGAWRGEVSAGTKQ